MRVHYFNSQPHEEADGIGGGSVATISISTHSLTRRLTEHCFRFRWRVEHFNSQPHEEADRSTEWVKYSAAYFNSQPHEEADQLNVSQVLTDIIFQLTASRGGWLHQTGTPTGTGYFNSQPHEEADLTTLSFSPEVYNFNSQPHEEADGIGGGSVATISISTHSLTRRLTEKVKAIAFDSDISTHSLTRRLTISWAVSNLSISFQLTASRGGWPRTQSYCRCISYFNSQPHEEADRVFGFLGILRFYFNSQPHEEADFLCLPRY